MRFKAIDENLNENQLLINENITNDMHFIT